ncbi:uncharacterized protein RHIMIDRAFT_275415 [Rhizopus microsporus ATCC 52813]|uniref:Uncharacterized protein n=1 Tax=Rhizopus microsporus ATCC 52813 TaxID=1340429 RepID=A0A2G4T0M8_RHIZD|nr:uncharacterized protein RHIMIDRAFT_275415 [Rhizopus microsporus ATCC 52813]PHZ14547.1 hypothetical protein RHIMIDRAFT_275415 [Rhizopus microsporus ATCC 52813]
MLISLTRLLYVPRLLVALSSKARQNMLGLVFVCVDVFWLLQLYADFDKFLLKLPAQISYSAYYSYSSRHAPYCQNIIRSINSTI